MIYISLQGKTASNMEIQSERQCAVFGSAKKSVCRVALSPVSCLKHLSLILIGCHLEIACSPKQGTRILKAISGCEIEEDNMSQEEKSQG